MTRKLAKLKRKRIRAYIENKYGSVTQLAEYQAFNLGVVGSIPTGPTNLYITQLDQSSRLLSDRL